MCANDYLENITFKSGHTVLGWHALGCNIKNIYLDFEEEDGYGSDYLYISTSEFDEVEDFEEGCQLSHIYTGMEYLWIICRNTCRKRYSIINK